MHLARAIAHATLVLAVAIAVFAGCASESTTEIVLAVRSSFPVPAALDSVRVEVTGRAMGPGFSRDVALRGAGAVVLPLTAGLYPVSADSLEVHVHVTGFLAGAVVVEQRIRTEFVTGARKLLLVDLSCRCVACGASCSSQCDSTERDTGALPSYDGSVPDLVESCGAMDGGTDAGARADAGKEDGGAALDASATRDSGTFDAGVRGPDAGDDAGEDAGTDAGFDAGPPPDGGCMCDDAGPCTRVTCGAAGCIYTPRCAFTPGDCASTMCTGGVCVPVGLGACSGDAGPCRTWICNAMSRCAASITSGAPCNDYSNCTQGETCNATGMCVTTDPTTQRCPVGSVCGSGPTGTCTCLMDGLCHTGATGTPCSSLSVLPACSFP